MYITFSNDSFQYVYEKYNLILKEHEKTSLYEITAYQLQLTPVMRCCCRLWCYWRPCRCIVHYWLVRELLSQTLDHLLPLNCCRTSYIDYEDERLQNTWKSHWTPSLPFLGQQLPCSMDHLKDAIYIENDSHEHRFSGRVTNISVLLTGDHQVIGRASHVADRVTCFTLIISIIIEI